MTFRRFNIFVLIFLTLMLQGCLNKQKLLDFPEAENQVVTLDGRHFFTSGKALAEIVKVEDEYTLQEIDAGCDGYSGIDVQGDWLFVVCLDNSLIAGEHQLITARIKQGEQPEFETLVSLSQLSLPNGLAIAPLGDYLYIADFVLLGRGKVSKYSLDTSNGSPKISLIEGEYLSVQQDVHSPNGLKFLDDDLYVTDFNVSGFQSRLLKINETASGDVVTEVLYEKNTIFDDLLPTCGGVLVADYINGRLIFVNSEAEAYQSKFQEFPGISSMRWGQPPLFEKGSHLIVTERGIIQDGITDIGNQITSIPISNLLKNEVGAQCSF